MKDFTLNEEQEAALDMLNKFRRSDAAEAGLFGAAGTGKSTVLIQFLKQIPAGIEVLPTAPTHKAVQVLYGLAREHYIHDLSCRTLQSALSMVPSSRPGTDEFVQAFGALEGCPAGKYDVVVVDECSMVGEHLYDVLTSTAKYHGFQVIFTGDPYQLPPVKEEHKNNGRSFTFNVKPSTLLQTVERCDGDLLRVAVDARNRVGGSSPPMPFPSEEVKWTKSKKQFFETLLEHRETGKYIAYHNASVHWVNEWIHEQIHGIGSPCFLSGEHVIGKSSNEYWRAQQPFVIDQVRETEVHGFPCYRVTLRPDVAFMDSDEVMTDTTLVLSDRDLNPYWFNVVMPSHRKMMEARKNELKEIAKSYDRGDRARGRAWREFYEFKNLFADIRHKWAATVHSSQGSTYEKVFVAQRNISRCRDLKLRSKLQYVAYSRASDFLMIC